MIVLIGATIAVTLALVIGANNAGVSMAPAYGAGSRSRAASLLLFAVFSALGAVLVGPMVLEAVGRELFTAAPGQSWALLILGPGIALAVITLATILRVPFPTTPAAISALVGVGLYHGIVDGTRLTLILAWWVAIPLVILVFTWLVGRLLVSRFPKLLDGKRGGRWIGLLLTIEGCYSAFAVGANNTANAFAPLLTTGHFGIWTGVILSAAAFGVGALLWGGRVLETVGKGITKLCPVRALVVGLISATGLLVASIFGVPISAAFGTTAAVFGFSFATRGIRSTTENRNVRRILLVWATGPASGVILAYLLSWVSV